MLLIVPEGIESDRNKVYQGIDKPFNRTRRNWKNVAQDIYVRSKRLLIVPEGIERYETLYLPP